MLIAPVAVEDSMDCKSFVYRRAGCFRSCKLSTTKLKSRSVSVSGTSSINIVNKEHLFCIILLYFHLFSFFLTCSLHLLHINLKTQRFSSSNAQLSPPPPSPRNQKAALLVFFLFKFTQFSFKVFFFKKKLCHLLSSTYPFTLTPPPLFTNFPAFGLLLPFFLHPLPPLISYIFLFNPV